MLVFLRPFSVYALQHIILSERQGNMEYLYMN